jgi:hypothetical protein
MPAGWRNTVAADGRGNRSTFAISLRSELNTARRRLQQVHAVVVVNCGMRSGG